MKHNGHKLQLNIYYHILHTMININAKMIKYLAKYTNDTDALHEFNHR